MTHHRIKFGPGARGVLAGHFAERAAEILGVEDLTSGGTKLTFARLAPNAQGRRIRIFGRSLVAEAGPDSVRLDTFFVFRITRGPVSAPATAASIIGKFELLGNQHARELDPVGPVFADAAQGASRPRPVAHARVSTTATPRTPRMGLLVSDRLGQVLVKGGAELRATFRPRAQDEPVDLVVLRSAWRQLVENIRRRPSAATREDLILAGTMEPRDMTEDEGRALRSYFESVFVSDVLERQAETPERVAALASELGRSTIASDETRALLWSSSSSSLSAAELEVELLTLAETLGSVTDKQRERIWWDAICSRIYGARADAGSPKDASAQEELLALLRTADDSDSSNLAELAAWAQRRRSQTEATRATRTDTISAPSLESAIDSTREFRVELAVEPPEGVGEDLAGAALTAEHRAVVEEWTMRRRGMAPDGLEELRSELAVVRDAAATAAAKLDGLSGMAELPAFAQVLQDFVERHRLQLATETAGEWRLALDNSTRAFISASAHVAADVVVKAIDRPAPPSVDDVVDAAKMFDERSRWALLPSWWWDHIASDDGATESRAQSPLDDVSLFQIFTAASSRNLTKGACERLQDLATDLLTAVVNIRPPPRGTTADDHLAAELTLLSRTLGHARQKYAASLGRLLDEERISQEDLVDLAALLDELEGRLSPVTFSAFCDECGAAESAGPIRQRLRACNRTLDEFATFLDPNASSEQRRGLTSEMTWTQLRTKMGQLLAVADAAKERDPELDLTLQYADVGATITDDETKQKETIPDRPPLFFSARGALWGYVRLPIVVRSRRPRNLELTFSLREDKSPLRANWPSSASADWPGPALDPTNWTIEETDWHEDGAEYAATVPLSLPIRRPEKMDAKLSFILVARTSDGAEVAQRYSWERFVLEADEDGAPILKLEWTPQEDPVLARAVPVGPQVHFREALQRIREGGPLGVTAPRRFGKSSLLALLDEKLSGDGDEANVTVRIDCNHASSSDSRRLDHARLWALVSDELGRKLSGARLGASLDGQSPPLPTVEDFKAVRALAHVQGKRRIVVFFDEAQRMFDTGPLYGDRLRTLITRDLVDRSGLAQVVFCFIGLTTMTSERLGQELHPLLRPLAHSELREEQITKVIRKVIGKERTIFTTRAARERLARSSWNLYALRTLLSRIRERLREDGRLWVSVEDVIMVEEQLLSELRRGENPEAIITYIRDSLNAGTHASDFRPVPAFPVATAYARALDDNRVGKDASDATQRMLKEWSSSLFRDHLARPRFDESLIAKHLDSLVEMRVLDRVKDVRGGMRFRSEFLRSYLVGQLGTFLGEDWFRESFLQAGTRSIRLPPEGERTPLGEGAQAHAFLFERNGERLTARVRELKSEAEQDAFLENLVVSDKITKIHQGHREGSESIFKLQDVGLAEGTPRPAAVEVYRFIPGGDLGTRVGKLDVPMVLKIGRVLCRALTLVHGHDLLHRDIRPENVILQDHAFPVLIDFGLACVRSAPGATPLDDPFTAPEVKKANPEWSAAADVFALAKTLDALLSRAARGREDGATLVRQLATFTTVDPKPRDAAEKLSAVLEEVAARLNVKGRESAIVDRLVEVVRGDPKESDLRWLVEDGCLSQVKGFAFGNFGSERERLRAAAFIVNKLFERCFDGESVAARAKYTLLGNWPVGIEAIVILRNEFAHAKAKRRDYTVEQLLAGVETVSTWLGTHRLRELTQRILALS
jgi:hypothetical protein